MGNLEFNSPICVSCVSISCRLNLGTGSLLNNSPTNVWGSESAESGTYPLKLYNTSCLCVCSAKTATNATNATVAGCVCTSNATTFVRSNSSCVSLYFGAGEKLKTITNGACIIGCGFATDFVASSDCRLKTNINPISNALSTVNQLQGVTYNLCFDEKKENRIGLLAQEVNNVLPEVVSCGEPSENDKCYGITDYVLGIKYENIIPVLIEAIKEQQKEINKLKNKISSIENMF